MGFKDLFTGKKRNCVVQTSERGNTGFGGWRDYMPLASAEYGLYSGMRMAVPIIDAALDKIVRLTGGFEVICDKQGIQAELDDFISNIRVGAGGCGLHQFISVYLDGLLTYGNAVGEIVLDAECKNIYALYNAGLNDVVIRRGEGPLDIEIGTGGRMGFSPVRYPELVIFTPLNPPAGEVLGESLLRSLPFVTSILLKIYNSVSTNFERVANLRYAVTYKPGGSGVDKAQAKDIAGAIAAEWSDAMSSAAGGVIKDFVAVGDVDIKVIGADNQMIDTEVPVRQMLEQIVAKLGIPPFMLGLHWSTTERMSTQQADILTSELESYRKILTGVIRRICSMWMRLNGYVSDVEIKWDDINLQDELEAARAMLISAQAANLTGEGAQY